MKLSTKILAVVLGSAIAVTLVVTAVAATPVDAAYVFTRDLTVGSIGADVMELQKVLNSNPATQVAASGVGAPGMESTYFGSLTRAALAKWQAANNIAPAVGYFGPLTRGAINSAAPANVPLCPNGKTLASNCTANPGTTPGTSTGGLQGGAGDVTITLRSSGTDDEVLEGDEDVKVLGFDVEAEGSDIAVTSAKIEFTHTGSGSDRLDRYVDEVSILLDGKVVGTADADDFSESNDVYSRSIALTGAVVDEDETGRFQVAVSAVGNIDSDDLSTAWDVELDQIRFNDATGAILTETPAADAIDASFTFESLSTSGDIELSISENDQTVNASHTEIVDTSSDTNDVDILSFSLEADGSDISLDTLSFGVTSNSGTGVTEIASDFRLLMDGDEVGTVTVDKDCDGGSDGFGSTTDEAICVVVSDLDDDDVVVEEGDEIDFMLVADINDVDGGFSSGDDLSAQINGDVTLSSNGHVEAEDANGDTLTISELSGSADSSTINFLSSGITVTTVSTATAVDTFDGDVATDDVGIFTIVFDVTAVEDTAFIELGTATRGTTETNTGANFVIQDADNSYAATTTGSISLADLTRVSGGSLNGEFVQINSGQTARFQLQVSFNPAHTTGEADGYRMRLYSVNSAATAVDATAQEILTPEVDYRTGSKAIGN